MWPITVLLIGINLGLLAYYAWLCWTDAARKNHKKD